MIGGVYLIQPTTLIGTNRYKIGCSIKKSADDRIKTGYHKGTKKYIVSPSGNPLEVEKNIKKKFNEKFNLIAGNEYFEGNISEMIKEFMIIYNTINIFPVKQEIEETLQDKKKEARVKLGKAMRKKREDYIKINNKELQYNKEQNIRMKSLDNYYNFLQPNHINKERNIKWLSGYKLIQQKFIEDDTERNNQYQLEIEQDKLKQVERNKQYILKIEETKQLEIKLIQKKNMEIIYIFYKFLFFLYFVYINYKFNIFIYIHIIQYL